MAFGLSDLSVLSAFFRIQEYTAGARARTAKGRPFPSIHASDASCRRELRPVGDKTVVDHLLNAILEIGLLTMGK